MLAGIVESLFIIPTLYGFLKFRRGDDIDKSARYINYLLFATILITLFIFQFKECVIAWALLFPFIAMNLRGAEKGLHFIIIFNIIVYVGAYYFWFDHHASMISYTRFVTVSFIISVLVYVYEKIIDSSFEKQIELNKSLQVSIKEARILSITDSLTNLYNKRHFDSIFNEEFNRARRTGEPFVFAIIDVDNFKPYNDMYGHDCGNYVVERVGDILNQQTVRSGDYAFRIGGEEFAIILQSSSSENTYKYLNKLRQKIEDEKIEHINNKPYGYLTVSIGGVSISNYEAMTIVDAYRMADKNLYAMKNNGRNEVKLTML